MRNKTPLTKVIINLLFITTLTVPCLFQSAHARWATLDDTEVSMEAYNRDIHIRKDGTYTETIEMTMKAIKEGGKDKLVSLPLTYNSSNTELKILEAKTIRDGKEYPVDLKHIEDKPLASSPHGFDQNNQILIAFPEMALNASAYIKYQEIVKKPAIPGFFATNFVYGMGEYFKTSHIHVTSELPFFVQANDKEQVLDIKHNKSKDQQSLDIVLKKPVIKLPIDEQAIAVDSSVYPWVTVSTLENWTQFGEQLVKRYEAVINQKLPSLYEDILKEASSKKTTIEKINTVTARLSEKITYMGDWRTIEGAIIPRNLEEIYKSKLGDCKDFSASTTAILRKLGMKANVALVNRGMENNESPTTLPIISEFNHAFLRVQEGDKVYWIDPTNFTSFAQGIYPDIAERNALVLDPTKPILTRTAAIDPKDSEIQVLKKIALPRTDADVVHVSGQISMTGVQALPLIGADLRASKESINHGIINAVADESRTVHWKVDDYDLTSRIAHNVNFKFNLTEKHTQMKTTAGKSFLLPSQQLIFTLLSKTHDRISDLRLDIPTRYRYEALLPKASLVGSEFSNCSVDSPWFKGSRKIKDTPEGIRVIDELVVKKDKITNAELKSKEYSDFQNSLYTCFGNTALVYKIDSVKPIGKLQAKN